MPGSEVRGHLKVLAVSNGELGVELDEFRRERLARRAPARAARGGKGLFQFANTTLHVNQGNQTISVGTST